MPDLSLPACWASLGGSCRRGERIAGTDPVLWTDPEMAVLEEELAALGEELARAEAALAEARGC
jgi:hypothetical protein